jgi:hypothetical protein
VHLFVTLQLQFARGAGFRPLSPTRDTEIDTKWLHLFFHSYSVSAKTIAPHLPRRKFHVFNGGLESLAQIISH